MSGTNVPTLLDDNIVIDVVTGTSRIFWGPPSIFAYTILQGLFTVLAIKEVISITRSAVKGSSSSLRTNRSILMSMVENWEDLAKVTRQLIWQRPLHKHSRHSKLIAPLNKVGWRRFILSGFIALWLFGIDMALIVLSVPNRTPQNIEAMTKVKWENTGDIPKLNKSTTLHGSFSKAVKLEPFDDDVEFTRLPAVSLERTDFRDFGTKLPAFDGRIISCNSTEEWRIICRVRCDKRYYQYKLRMDVHTDTNSSTFYVPTTDFSYTGSKNNVEEYARQIESQLGIGETSTMATERYFEINSTREPDEYTVIDEKEILTHDAIATLFLKTIEIKQAPPNELYFARESGKRMEERNQEPRGAIAISQRPYLPLLGTAAFYIVMQIISIIQQKAWNLHIHSGDMIAVLEVSGGDVMENFANIVVEDRPLVETTLESSAEFSTHVGYLPVDIIMDIKNFSADSQTDEEREKLPYTETGEAKV